MTSSSPCRLNRYILLADEERRRIAEPHVDGPLPGEPLGPRRRARRTRRPSRPGSVPATAACPGRPPEPAPSPTRSPARSRSPSNASARFPPSVSPRLDSRRRGPPGSRWQKTPRHSTGDASCLTALLLDCPWHSMRPRRASIWRRRRALQRDGHASRSTGALAGRGARRDSRLRAARSFARSLGPTPHLRRLPPTTPTPPPVSGPRSTARAGGPAPERGYPSRRALIIGCDTRP